MQADSLSLEIEVPDRVPAGRSVTFTLRAKNTGAEPVDLYLRGREIAFDLSVASAGGEVLWRRLEGTTVPAILQVLTLAPGESLELSDVWDQHTGKGMLAGSGVYMVEGALPMDAGRTRKTPAVAFRII